jgi:hypothetical protein
MNLTPSITLTTGTGPRRLLAAILLTAATCALSACADEIADVRSAVRRADLEVDAHHETVAASASLADARAEVERHAELINADIRDIRHNLDDSEDSCDEDDLDRVWAVVVEVERRVDDYLQEAAELDGMDQMIGASADYRGDMERLFDDLGGRVDQVDCL